MGSIQKIYVRSTRDDLGRYPTWPIGQRVQLGQVGHYQGRSTNFVWETNLSRLGLQVPELGPESLSEDEMYLSQDSVSYEFSAEAGEKLAKVNFDFKKRSSIVSQGYQMGQRRLDLVELKQQLVRGIQEGRLNWRYHWVIVTEVWLAKGFTTLISGSKASISELSARAEAPGASFNIADIGLGVKLTAARSMAYRNVAVEDTQPYFQIHRLWRNHELEVYGGKRWLF